MKSPLYRRFREELQIRGLSKHTQQTYVRIVECCAEHFLRNPDEISDQEVHDYLLFLIRNKNYAFGTLGSVVAALRAFYRMVLRRSTEDAFELLPPVKRIRKLPRFYTTEEIQRLLSADGLTIKARTMLITAYATGLRVSEVCQLKVTDVVSSRMQIHVQCGKGGVDRYTLLSPILLNVLRNYWRIYRPNMWLFPSPRNPMKPLSSRSLQRSFKCAVEKTGLPRRGGVHSLRHSFATHLVDFGASLPTVQTLLGHQWLHSTMVYLHTSTKCLMETRSPLDMLGVCTGSMEPMPLRGLSKAKVLTENPADSGPDIVLEESEYSTINQLTTARVALEQERNAIRRRIEQIDAALSDDCDSALPMNANRRRKKAPNSFGAHNQLNLSVAVR
jgi:site-specific recombinase XerD